MRTHINNVSKTCYFHLRRLRQLRKVLPMETLKTLVSATVLPRLDYCNGLLIGLPAVSLDPLCRVQRAAARLVSGIGWNDSVTEAMRQLHWLPIEARITFKICVIMHNVMNAKAPEYLSELIVPVAKLQNRERLRSHTSNTCELPRVRTKFADRAFSVSGPRAWNSLPTELRSEISLEKFKTLLKSFLFEKAYNK